MPANLSPDETRRTLEEFRDHALFCRESLNIQNKQGQVVPFYESPANQKVSAAIRSQEIRGEPVRVVVLKARQVHNTAGCATHIFKRAAFLPGQQAMVFGDTYKAAKNVWGYLDQYDTAYSDSPFRGIIKPKTISRVQPTIRTPGWLKWGERHFIESNTAKNVQAGRSYSLRHLLLSEYGFYRDAATLMTGLLQCVPEDPYTTILVESTANGMGGPFWELCMRAMDPLRRGGWVFVFFGWQEHPEYTKPLTEDPHRFVESLTREEQDLRVSLQLTLDQLNWRRWCITDKCEGSEDRFHQEYPGTPEEAFLASGRPRFDQKALARMPLIRDPIAGELERVRVGTREQIHFMPREDGHGALRVWKKPRQGGRYAIGADPAEGIDVGEEMGTTDPDYSVAVVGDADTGEQVATLRARLTPATFGAYVVDLGAYYNSAFLVPEAVGSGLALIEEILRLQYPLDRIYTRRRAPDDRRALTLQEIGFKTSMVTRPQLISTLDRGIREASIIIRDPLTMLECRTFVYTARGKEEHQQGCHDDCVIALALMCVGIVAMPRESMEKERRKIAPQKYGKGGRRAPERGRIVRW